VGRDGRPLIEKLGTVDVDKVENSPVVFRGELYRFEWYRNEGCFHFVHHGTGRTTPRFAHGYSFGNAFIDGDTAYVTGTKVGPVVQIFVSKDLEHWDTYSALERPSNYKIYNTSICEAGDRYVMMYEVGEPPQVAGVPFTAFFAESKDLRHWTPLPLECNYCKDRYTAPHCLRYSDGWFYDFYLEAVSGGYEQCVVRSKDLVHWDASALNPVLRASEEDRKILNPALSEAARRRIAGAKDINNSDIDMCEYRGHLVIVYSWGNQVGTEHLAEARYDGTLEQFLRGWFPKK
jgi:beta-xylosidase